jgi:hypothetical protein
VDRDRLVGISSTKSARQYHWSPGRIDRIKALWSAGKGMVVTPCSVGGPNWRTGAKTSSARSSTGVAPDDPADLLALQVFGEGRDRWHRQEREEAVEIVGRRADEIAVPAQHVFAVSSSAQSMGPA